MGKMKDLYIRLLNEDLDDLPCSSSDLMGLLCQPNTDAEEEPQELSSPCVRKCYKLVDGVCHGCFRTVPEILQWWNASDDEKRAILKRCRERAATAEKDIGL